MLENNLDKSVGFSIKLRTIVYTTALLGGIWAIYTLALFYALHDFDFIVKDRANIVKIVEVQKEIYRPMEEVKPEETPKVLEAPKKAVKLEAPKEQKTSLKLDYNLSPAPVVEAPKPAPAPVAEAPKPQTEFIGAFVSKNGNMCQYNIKENGQGFKVQSETCPPAVKIDTKTGVWQGVNL